MTLKETLHQLEALGNEKMRAQTGSAGDNQFGVRLGDILKLTAKIWINEMVRRKG